MKFTLLTDEFMSQYPDFPEHMTPLGKFVYYRTYSRWLETERRRETWKETVRRAVEYNCRLANTSQEEAQKLFDNHFNLKQALSGRTLWVGGTVVAEKYPLSNFNCAFIILDSVESLRDMFYLLMVGTGVGFRILKSDVDKFPKVKQGIKLTHRPYDPVPKQVRDEYSNYEFMDGGKKAIIYCGDSKEGWVQAVEVYFKLLTDPLIKIEEIEIVYDSVRPQGERLNTFGGFASGHESLKVMFEKIHKVINTDEFAPKPENGIMRPINLYDVATSIGQNVVVGGVRRTALIALLDEEDDETITAKQNIFSRPELSHRFMSNNSIFYNSKPTRERMAWQFEVMRGEGEPAYVNAEAARKRRKDFEGVNPCVEILLKNKQTCNLTTVNVFGFVSSDEQGNPRIDLEGLVTAFKLSARAAYRMTCTDLELPSWSKSQKDDRLLGCSMTGWKDAISFLGYTTEQEVELMNILREAARNAADEYADELGLNRSLLVTAVKPEGTLSQVMGGVSSGLHHAHSPHFIRRVRISAHDPLCKAMEDMGFFIVDEVNQGIEINGEYVPVSTRVVEFPTFSPTEVTKYDVPALKQLETYYNFQDNYTEHNSSNTITVRPHEWAEVEQNIWDNWDDMVAVSFLGLDDSVYPLLPYEAIDEATYNDMMSAMPEFDEAVLQRYDAGQNSDELELEGSDADCSSGSCPIR